MQELIRQVQEACAKAAEGFDDDRRDWVKDSLYDVLRRETAAAIRALDLSHLVEPTCEAVLMKPASIGGVRFHAGVKVSHVLRAAERRFEYEQSPEYKAEQAERAADFMAELRRIVPPAPSQVQDGWVSITERLPEEQDMYLGMLREDNPLGWTWERPVEVAFGYLLHDRQRFSVFDPWAHENVDIQDSMTHWMPLPAAPKEPT